MVLCTRTGLRYGDLDLFRGIRQLINLHFDPPIRSNPLDELKELHHTRTVVEYQRQFLMLLCRCEGLSPDWASQCALMMRFSDPPTFRQPSSWQECLNAAQVWQPSRLQVQAPIPSTVHGPPCQEPQSATWRPQPVRRSPCFSAYNP
jgi:hypothetical protein